MVKGGIKTNIVHSKALPHSHPNRSRFGMHGTDAKATPTLMFFKQLHLIQNHTNLQNR